MKWILKNCFLENEGFQIYREGFLHKELDLPQHTRGSKYNFPNGTEEAGSDIEKSVLTEETSVLTFRLMKPKTAKIKIKSMIQIPIDKH